MVKDRGVIGAIDPDFSYVGGYFFVAGQVKTHAEVEGLERRIRQNRQDGAARLDLLNQASRDLVGDLTGLESRCTQIRHAGLTAAEFEVSSESIHGLISRIFCQCSLLAEN